MNVWTKILLFVVCVLAVTTVAMLYLEKRALREQNINDTVVTMRTMVRDAEYNRDKLSSFFEKGVVDIEKLTADLDEVHDIRESTLYGMIPIVSAWQGLQGAAREEGYEFRVVNPNPRNPDNLPDAREREILSHFTSGSGESEFTEVNEEAQHVVYARPVHATQDCLTCHGDPASSPTGDGRDLLGFKMENKKAGDLMGAFILTKPFDDIEAATNKLLLKSTLTMLPLFGLIVGGLAFFLQRGIARPLKRTISSIDEASEQTEQASMEISSASHSLAEGASEQAAALEETNATLEGISRHTSNNAETAMKARQSADQAAAATESGRRSVAEMVSAMQAIRQSSDETSAIIKTIDEIAFQTNILSLNAAVEAARAGEAGAGFSVVAGEVRSLAQRSAEAARETSTKIAAALERSENGVSLSEQVSKDLADIAARITEVHQFMEEVATASLQQKESIGQINGAVGEMDSATQAAAANAEETASAATELSAQASFLKESVEELVAITEGRSRRAAKARSGGSAPGDSPKGGLWKEAPAAKPAPRPASQNGHATAETTASAHRW